jgi:hypothetical protein
LLGGSACSFKKIDIGCSGGGVAQWSTLPPPEQKIVGSNKGCMVVGFYIEMLLRKKDLKCVLFIIFFEK